MNKKIFYKSLATIAVALALGLGSYGQAFADSLYIGDGGDNTVKKFDANTGKFLGALVPSQGNGLIGPMGIMKKGNELLVVNQNVDLPFNGEILKFNRHNGAFLGALVPCQDDLKRPCDPNSPFTPRGIIRGPGNKLYVADLFGSSFDPSTEGSLKEYDINKGNFIRNLDRTGFKDRFHPRGLVIGPDGLLYVSIRGFETGLEGYILRFNPISGKFVDIFASNLGSGCAAHLHRPEGLVFGPDNKLYVTAFRADANDTDKILVFNSRGKCVDSMNLDVAGQTRAFSQAILFGPNGQLFVSIQNNPGPPFGGEVRRCNIKTKQCRVFIPNTANGGALISPWYMTFGETDSRTLEYED